MRDLQQRLIDLNYLSTQADGIFGPGTEQALKDFQELNGLEITGTADENTLNALFADAPVPMPTPEPTPRVRGAKGDEIRQVQQALQIMGFMGGDADGDFGPETENSVKRYQSYVHQRPPWTTSPRKSRRRKRLLSPPTSPTASLRTN